MAVSFLDFEQPIAELEAKIEELRHVKADPSLNIDSEIARLQAIKAQLQPTQSVAFVRVGAGQVDDQSRLEALLQRFEGALQCFQVVKVFRFESSGSLPSSRRRVWSRNSSTRASTIAWS